MRTHSRLTMAVAVGSTLALLPDTTRAQSAQALSVQVSGLYASLFGDPFEGFKSGTGFEAQLRYTFPSGFSVGAGYQRTTHEIDFNDPQLNSYDQDVSLSGPFIEPRYTFELPGSTSIFPYISGRLSMLQQNVDLSGRFDTGEQFFIDGESSGLTANLGGGILARLAPRVNLDVGVTYGYTNFDDLTLRERGSGVSETSEWGSGQNVVARIGLSIGLR